MPKFMRYDHVSFLALIAVLLPATTLHAQCDPADLFGPNQQFPTGSAPYSVAIGDLNGDGVPDLAVANHISPFGTVSILLGNGDGTFQTGQNFATGGAPYSVAIGDLNGDSVPDIATVNRDSNTVSVLLGLGDGTFKPYQDFSTSQDPLSIAIADLNGDGILDLVVVNRESNSASVLLGNGDGTFLSHQDFATASEPTFVAISDLNADGILDLVVTAIGEDWEGPGMVSLLLGVGDGTFQPRQDFAVGSGPLSVAVADLNGDGIPDLVVANYNSNFVSVLMGSAHGDFELSQTPSTGPNPISVAIADLNNDGIADFTVASYGAGSVGVFIGTGNGFFLNHQEIPAGSRPRWVAISDIDNDGMPDLSVADSSSGSIYILLNQCTPSLPCKPDLDNNRELNFFDLAIFVAYFQTRNPIADFNDDGQFNFFDFAVFLKLYNLGCPRHGLCEN